MAIPYADYAYYTGTYLGSAVSSSDFSVLSTRASAALDRLSYGRVSPVIAEDTDLVTIDLIKMATCAMVDELNSATITGTGGGVTSESVGGYSVSYAQGAPATLTTLTKMKQAAATYLENTGLMYPGFAPGEYSRGRGYNTDWWLQW